MTTEIDPTSRLLGNIEAQLTAQNNLIIAQGKKLEKIDAAVTNHRVKTAGLSATITMITLFCFAVIKKWFTGEY